MLHEHDQRARRREEHRAEAGLSARQAGPAARKLLAMWPEMQKAYAGDEYVVKIRDKEDPHRARAHHAVGHQDPQGGAAAVRGPRRDAEVADAGQRARQLPLHRRRVCLQARGEDPTRMFAGEGDAFRTNRRFKLVSEGMPAKRLSTAFDSVTLYGNDPDPAPRHLRQGGQQRREHRHAGRHEGAVRRLRPVCPATSVSMTINGPAPSILAMFMNTAIDQQLDKFRADNGREPTDDRAAKIRAWVLANVRGTVQADILKEDQGQNTCIFSTEFSLKVMGDIAEYFVHHDVRNFYSVSISGYHIAEAGANPISQLAFTLSNGFTFVEAYLARGMHIDDFAPNLSFFFSNGMDPSTP
jgi:methylmalonyl-CoA mutase